VVVKELFFGDFFSQKHQILKIQKLSDQKKVARSEKKNESLYI